MPQQVECWETQPRMNLCQPKRHQRTQTLSMTLCVQLLLSTLLCAKHEHCSMRILTQLPLSLSLLLSLSSSMGCCRNSATLLRVAQMLKIQMLPIRQQWYRNWMGWLKMMLRMWMRNALFAWTGHWFTKLAWPAVLTSFVGNACLMSFKPMHPLKGTFLPLFPPNFQMVTVQHANPK